MTKAQEKFLRECHLHGGVVADAYQMTVAALKKRRLIQSDKAVGYRYNWHLTDAGRSALAALDAKRGGE